MIIRCAVCKKQVVVQWPELWGYKRKNRFMCSWKCLREFDNKEKGAKDVYTKTKKDGTPAKTPGPKAKKELNIGKDEVKATPPTVKLDGAIRIETPEAHNVDIVETPEAPKRAPLVYDGYTVCCIESKTFGRFYWDRDHNHLDWTTAEGEEVSFTPTGWKMFLEELPKVAAILGVEL